MIVSIEAMQLLPQSFVLRRPALPPKGRLKEQRRSSSKPLFGLFESLPHPSRGGLFRFGGFLWREVEIELWLFIRRLTTVIMGQR